MSFFLKTPKEIAEELAAKAKAQRLAQNLTQEGLSKRAGVTVSSLKRFERTGLISLESLLKIALVLDSLQEFENLFLPKVRTPDTLDELLKTRPVRRKGRIN